MYLVSPVRPVYPGQSSQEQSGERSHESAHSRANKPGERRERRARPALRWFWLALLLLALLPPHTAQAAPHALPAPAASVLAPGSSEVAVEWYEQTLALVRTTPGFAPPIAARAFGYMGVALYETVRPAMPGAASLAGQLNELTSLPVPPPRRQIYWPAAANGALSAAVRGLFPTVSADNLAAVDALERRYAAAFTAKLAPGVYERSAAYGRQVAAAVLAWAATDGGPEAAAELYPADYVPPVGPEYWVSTPPNHRAALLPSWGDIRPFALMGGAECMPGPPPAFSTDPGSQFYREANEVYQTGNSLTDEQRAVALFWADDAGWTATPGGHYVSILNQVLRAEDAPLALAAQGYARLGVAAADAFIGCWRAKFTFNVVRPITYIQRWIDPAWNADGLTDVVETPPFPEYTSGHSVVSGAAAEILAALFGDEYTLVDHTHETDLGLPPRTYSSFRAMAEEAAFSRLYGGIHYRSGILAGLEQGRCIAARALALELGPPAP